ncbi:MAG: hypothetical protein A3F72_17455 [Bacteroidetes bacterium RIFCSPLOWO2_12_FULL_35_15]|nr:MAG: hypothetical protein A3F72_17455 [Bacteroidetes bacterium RIFCSPLOWO2_12_FULL_35_15]
MKERTTLFLLLFVINSFAQNGNPFNRSPVVCDLTLITTLQTFNVYNHNPTGVTMYKAKMYIDADGSPRAYGPNNSGLDWTANAGSTGNWWGVVADATGTNPILQSASDPYPGMYVSTTSLVNSAYPSTNPLRYTNSETVPFFVLPSSVVSLGGIRIGDIAYVYNTVTGLGCYAIYADTGPSASLGEGSIYLAGQIGVNPNARTGGTSLGIIDYIVFPYSGYGQGTIPTIAQIDSIGNLKIATVGGTGITACLETNTGDPIAPTTQISIPAGWDTTSFISTFTDVDNSGGSGIEKSFYQVTDYNTNNDWRANYTHGFFNDNFDLSTINPEWSAVSGTWSINTNNFLQQSDENVTNTNIYSPLVQNLSDCYLYNWTGILGGTGTSRRAGFHFFADQPDSTNRGNSYFVWFRLDDQKIQIYKSINNSWGASPVKDTAHAFTANQSYDFKVIYNRITGLIRVYVNDIMSAQWIDSSPLSNGSYISFRNANCTYQINNFKVYRSRNATATITVGAGNANDIRFQNQNPATPAGQIKSIVTDAAGNISTVSSQNVNVDWTPPSSVSLLKDGTTTDIDTTNNGTQLQGNWNPSVDANSGITNYYYAIGTSPGGTNVVGWTNNLNNLTLSATSLTLVNLQNYYISIKAEDGAGMKSSVVTSDGQLYYNLATTISKLRDEQNLIVFPNPSSGVFNIQFSNLNFSLGTITVTDALGREVFSSKLNSQNSNYQLDISKQANGLYYVVVNCDGKLFRNKVVVDK